MYSKIDWFPCTFCVNIQKPNCSTSIIETISIPDRRTNRARRQGISQPFRQLSYIFPIPANQTLQNTQKHNTHLLKDATV